MDFSTFKNIGFNYPDSPAIYSYKTSDALSLVIQEGYFSDPRAGMVEGDIVHALTDDGYSMLIADSSTTASLFAPPGHVTWFDDNDTATVTTPISHTGGDTDTYMTNDSLGPFTNEYDPAGLGGLWDADNNQFDFSRLKIGDWVDLRLDFQVTTTAANQEFNFYIALGAGGGAYELKAAHSYYKTAGVQDVTFLYSIYMGDTNTLDNPGKIRFESSDNATIKVDGWVAKVTDV